MKHVTKKTRTCKTNHVLVSKAISLVIILESIDNENVLYNIANEEYACKNHNMEVVYI
jgi:hypothetical protein